MLIITPQEKIDAYYADTDSESQSRLKNLFKGIANYNQVEDSNKSYFIIGSAVDTILTGEEGAFEKAYYVSTLESVPTDSIARVIDTVFSIVKNKYEEYLLTIPVKWNGESEELLETPMPFAEFALPFTKWEPEILSACNENSYQKNWKDETRVSSILSKEEGYFELLVKAEGKTVVDAGTYNVIKGIVDSLKTNVRTAHIFDRVAFANSVDVDMYLQLPIYFTYRGKRCKALLDIVIVVKDEKGNILTVHPIDLKTMSGNTLDFPNSIKARRYDIQGAWYTLALQEYFKVPSDRIRNFCFVVESTTNIGNPLFFECTKSLLETGRNGRKPLYLSEITGEQKTADTPVLVREILGFEQLLDIVIYHDENGWDEEKILKETPHNKPLQVNWEGIVEH